MIEVKKAVQIASEYLTDLYADKSFYDHELEEVELADDEKHWLITLSYATSVVPSVGRHYKQFKIKADTGQVVAMKIRRP